MKKLMIAAAAAAMVGGAYAACDITPAAGCAEVYDVVLNLKTTECKCAGKTIKSKSACEIISTSSRVAWRQVVTKKVQGVIWTCTCDCTDDVDGSILDAAVMAPAYWDGSVGNQLFWIAKDKVQLDASDVLTISWLARIGKDNKQVEAAGTFGTGINVAGYGAYDVSNRRVKNISGYAAGVWGGDIDCTDSEEAEICPAYKLCTPGEAVADFSKTFAAGTWSVKFNASKSNAYYKSGSALWGKVIPAAVLNYPIATTWYIAASL